MLAPATHPASPHSPETARLEFLSTGVAKRKRQGVKSGAVDTDLEGDGLTGLDRELDGFFEGEEGRSHLGVEFRSPT